MDYNWTGSRIIIADDDLINFELLKLIIGRTRSEVLHHKNGIEVIEYIETHGKVDLIVMDLQMPILDGIEATYQLREKGYQGVIIGLTAMSTKDIKGTLLKKGFNEIIEKPFDRLRLLKLIDDNLKMR